MKFMTDLVSTFVQPSRTFLAIKVFSQPVHIPVRPTLKRRRKTISVLLEIVKDIGTEQVKNFLMDLKIV